MKGLVLKKDRNGKRSEEGMVRNAGLEGRWKI